MVKHARQFWIAILAIAGLIGALLIREMCEATVAMDELCDDGLVLMLKLATTFGTAAHTCMMVVNLRTRDELRSVQKSLLERARGKPSRQTSQIPTQMQHTLAFLRNHWWVCFVWIPLNLVHPLPGISMVLEMDQMGLRPVYRMEGFIAAVMVTAETAMITTGRFCAQVRLLRPSV